MEEGISRMSSEGSPRKGRLPEQKKINPNPDIISTPDSHFLVFHLFTS
jgi:hypothetical protein